jgi:drug/metabolite transporter (DMT)-like permease
MDLKKFGVYPLILLYMVFPLSFSLSKMGMMYAPSTTFIALRMIITGLFFLLCYAVQHKGTFKLTFDDTRLFFQAGFFGIYLTYVPELWALQYLSVAKSAFLFVLAPFFTALFAHLYENELFSRKKIIGLIIALIGFIPILIVTADSEEVFKNFSFVNLPEIVTILSVACYAYSWIPIKKLMNEKQYSPWLINGVIMLGGGIGAAVTALFCDGWYKGVSPVTNWNAISWYLFLTLLVGVFCYILYTYLLKNFTTTLVSFFCFTEPFFAAFYGWYFLGETVSWMFFVSILIVSIGLYIFYQSELSQD